MNPEIFDKLPYISRKELIDLRNYIKVEFEENSHVIKEDYNESTLYQFRDFTGKYFFSIKFRDYDSQKNSNSYVINYNPRSETRVDKAMRQTDFSQIKIYFSRWISLVVKMHEVTSEYYDPYKKFYDEQFAEYFTNNDPDSAIHPFEIEKQEIIYYFLTYAEKVIANSPDILEDDKRDILNDLKQLKEDIPKLTKKRLVSSLSKISLKIKKISNKIFHEIFDVLKKEIIKKVLNEATGQIPNVFHKVESWINLLN